MVVGGVGDVDPVVAAPADPDADAAATGSAPAQAEASPRRRLSVRARWILAAVAAAIVAFVVSLLVVRFLMNYIRKHDFTAFGWYRIALGIVVILALVVLK